MIIANIKLFGPFRASFAAMKIVTLKKANAKEL